MLHHVTRALLRHHSDWRRRVGATRESPVSYISTKEAAEFLGLAPGTLRNWIAARRADAPPHHKFGARVLYSIGELQAWADAQRAGSILLDSTRRTTRAA
jgi:excisionase family DNA binding protein